MGPPPPGGEREGGLSGSPWPASPTGPAAEHPRPTRSSRWVCPPCRQGQQQPRATAVGEDRAQGRGGRLSSGPVTLRLHPFSVSYRSRRAGEQGATAGPNRLNLPLLSLVRKWRVRSTTVTVIISTRQTMRITSRREKEHLDLFPHMAGALRRQKGARGGAGGTAPASGTSHPQQHVAPSGSRCRLASSRPSARAGGGSNKDGKRRFIFQSA